jgi:hypothetical protein
VTRRGSRRSSPARALASTLALGALIGAPTVARADEGGVSFWVPGFISSFAASPLQPGFSFANIFYNTSVKAGADVAFARQVPLGRITANFNANLNIGLRADVPLYMAIPSYTFQERFLGGQANIALAVPYGYSKASVDATLTGNFGLGGPGFTLGASRTDEIDGFGDAAPMFNVRWNDGVHNYMAYITGNLTIGRYDPTRLANLGIGHNALDVGGAYTYLDPQTGREFSAVLGFTYNFENVHTQYQNGVDMHFDVSASQFISKQTFISLVGYAYQQLSCDSGSGDRVGCFESRVFGLGPQIGHIIPLGDLEGTLMLKGYKEWGAQHRPEGWNVWLTFAMAPAARPTTPLPRLTK